MAGLNAAPGGGWDYIQADTPADPEKGESWYDTDGGTDGNGEAKVYDGDQWDPTGYISHDQLNNVAAADHHNPVTVSNPLTEDGTQGLTLDIANALTVDGSGNLAVDESAVSLSNLSGYPIGTGDLGFDTATQAELDNHAATSGAHHSKPTGTQSQTQTTGRIAGPGYIYDGVERVGIFSQFTELEFYNADSNDSRSPEIEYADGSKDTPSIPADTTTWVSVNSNKVVRRVSVPTSVGWSGINQIIVGAHSHSI